MGDEQADSGKIIQEEETPTGRMNLLQTKSPAECIAMCWLAESMSGTTDGANLVVCWVCVQGSPGEGK